MTLIAARARDANVFRSFEIKLTVFSFNATPRSKYKLNAIRERDAKTASKGPRDDDDRREIIKIDAETVSHATALVPAVLSCSRDEEELAQIVYR